MSVHKPNSQQQKMTLDSRVFDSLSSTFPEFQCTIADIKFPKKDFVINFYLYVLEQLQFNPNKLIGTLLEDQFKGISHPEMFRESFQLISLMKSLRTILNKLHTKDGLQFGLNDLVDPSPARNSAFMFTLLNFFNFADARVTELKDKLDIVGERKSQLSELLAKREQIAREKNERAEKKVKMQDRAQQIHIQKLGFEALRDETVSLEKMSDKRHEELEDVARHICRVQSQINELKDTYHKLQAQQVQSPDVLKNSYKHLQDKLKETKLLLEQSQETAEEKKKILLLLETVEKGQDNRLILLKEIIDQAKEVKKLGTELANLELKLKSDSALTEASQARLNGLKKDLSGLTTQITTLELQHEKTKSSMKEGIRHLKEERKALEDTESSELESVLESIDNVQQEVNSLLQENTRLNKSYEKLYASLIQKEQEFTSSEIEYIDGEIAEMKLAQQSKKRS
ncbi:M protein, serotype 5-like [Frankliniella occidentalis]|uniref:M protein, serotype 5-like n=1 Tax=Frankliniella occidentalis TaxID=133901 RepID=A0A6J1S750_FRAOC|nr:M protein, serotype 5-like [Frankliniella occidentalis]